MTNRLAGETSPYLIQHAENPVHWWPWGTQAFEAARAGNKPVLLSVGYAACHWCHVMAHESFEDADIADVMNRLFVNIKVDREERPDIDQVYMAALHAIGQQGGWPLTMFLTPDGEPFWGGTYFPKTPRYGMPGFADVLHAIERTYREDSDRVKHNTEALVAHLRTTAASGAQGAPTEALLHAATQRLAELFDPLHGGLRGAPKFPQHGLFRLLAVQGTRQRDDAVLSKVWFAVDRISMGGIYDHVGGGYARYSVDERWLVPHFEKMLYDNGQLLSLLARAYTATGAVIFKSRIEETVRWLQSEMLLEEGGFASSLDADTHGEEGLTYVWTEEEINRELGAEAAMFKSVYDVTPEGNFEGKSILNRLLSGPLSDEASEARLTQSIARLKSVRDRRPQPGRDDKILADWNGYAIRGLADAAIALGKDEWLEMAKTAYRFVAESMADAESRLAHAFRAGRFTRPGLASDHASAAIAAIALHQASFYPAYLADAAKFLDLLDRFYGADDGLYYVSASDSNDLIIRPKSITDEATPNHHGLIVDASVSLYLLTGDKAHLERADRVLSAAGPAIGGNVLGAASLLEGFAKRLDLSSVVIVGPPGAERDALVDAARRRYPDAVLLVTPSTNDLAASHPAAGKSTIEGKPAAYVCRGTTCSLPAMDPTAL